MDVEKMYSWYKINFSTYTGLTFWILALKKELSWILLFSVMAKLLIVNNGWLVPERLTEDSLVFAYCLENFRAIVPKT